MKKSNMVKFTYTKDSDGDVSERVCIKMGYTSPKLVLMADITDISEDEDWTYQLAAELEDAHRAYLDDVKQVLEDYEVQQKTFKVSGITNEKEIPLRTGSVS